MDISDTIAPKSDQLDYVDLLAGPRTFTITGVRRGPSPDQPVQIDLKEFDRPWRPGKTMRRVLVVAWGADASQYVGRRVRLFGDPDVMFGGIAVGGSRISHLSHIDGTLTISLMVKRGKSAPYVVHPLDEAPQVSDDVAGDWVATIHAAETLAELQTVWEDARKQGVARDPRLIAAKDERKTLLTPEEAAEYEEPQQ
jgi:hypothetical protein